MNTLPKGPFEVSEDQRSTITHCLYVAAERFEENAKSANEIETYGVRHLGEQFTRQALEARALAERIDNAEYIEIGPDTPDEPAMDICDRCHKETKELHHVSRHGYDFLCAECVNLPRVTLGQVAKDFPDQA